ncbi:MAG: hypothetical protein OXE92_08270, partial [Bacteroidetes bacterium]|nr:hypothetical protein [Bacteroidota bacterium]
MHDTHIPVLAKISSMYLGPTEDIGTQALGHILTNSQPARDALSEILRISGADVGWIAEVKTQVIGESEAWPDIVAFGEDKSKCVLIKTEFWAGLIENRPLTYLKSFLEQTTPTLLFIAPHVRHEFLWAELKRHIRELKTDITFKNEESCDSLYSACVGRIHRLILISWTSLLDRIAAKVSAADDLKTEADIVQLRGLAAHEDSTAFMPWKAKELSPSIPRKLMELRNLVDNVTNELAERGLINTKKLGCTVLATKYVRYMNLVGADDNYSVKVGLAIDYENWATIHDTPLWLTLKEDDSKLSEEIWTNLTSLRQSDPPELFKSWNYPLIPIELPLSLESEALVDTIVQRVVYIADKIGCGLRYSEIHSLSHSSCMSNKHIPLLAKISSMFKGQMEDVAVEALGHILACSQPARDALLNTLRIGGAKVRRIVDVQTQAFLPEGAWPDLAAYGEDNSTCALIEAKFWAGLTKNQPLTYLRYLPDGKASALLFIAPHARRESLWAELKQRIKGSKADTRFENEERHKALFSARVGETHWLILVNWTCLLDHIAAKVSASGDSRIEADIAQLYAFTSREAQEDIITTPKLMSLKSEKLNSDSQRKMRPMPHLSTCQTRYADDELSPNTARRLIQLRNLVDSVTKQLHRRGLISLEGVHATPQKTGYMRYMKFVGADQEIVVGAALA